MWPYQDQLVNIIQQVDISFHYVLLVISEFVSQSPMHSAGLVTVIVIIFSVAGYLLFNLKKKVETVTARMMGTSKPRFRKRDKVIFYGRKMLRKVSAEVRQLSSQATSGRSRIKKRQMVLKFAKRLLRMKRDQPLTLQVKEPSQAFLEEDIYSELPENKLPSEVVYMLKSIRVFGIFEKPLFLEVCKCIENLHVPAGQLLFSIGELDDSIYVVQDGRLQVFVTESDGSELTFKEVPPGESVASLLSIMDVMTGHSDIYKTVSARAVQDSNILRLRVEAFKRLLEKYPESLVRVVQIVMVRLHRVTFTALHNYLGLTTQLVRSTPARKLSPKGSPYKPPSTKPNESSKSASLPAKPDSLPFEKGAIISEETESLAAGDDLSISNSGSSDNKLERISSQKQSKVSSDSSNLKRRKQSVSMLQDKNQLLPPEEHHRIAKEGIMNLLGIKDENMLTGKFTIREFPANAMLLKEDTQEDIALFYVLHGCLSVSMKTVDKDDENLLFLSHPGDLVGALAVITGEPSLFTIKTRQNSFVATINRNHTYDILRDQPHAVLYLAHTVVARLSPFVRQIDFALDWMNIESGRALYRQDDNSDSTYIVLSGRLRSVLTRSDGKKELVGEYGKGDLLGIVEVLTQTPRSTTVMAVRDSELAKLPEGLLNAIKVKYPVVVTRFIHLLGHRILGTLQKGGSLVGDHRAMSIGSRPSGSNFSTVALLPVTEDVPLSPFSLELYHALTAIGPTMRLTSELIRKTLGPSALDSANEYRLCTWLGQQEDHNRIVLYQCDSHFSTWTQRCIRQADCILIVALVDQEPTIGKVERQLEQLSVRTQKELILLHKEDGVKPKNTVEWLNMRTWCSSTHHICCPKRVFHRKSPLKQDVYNKMFESLPNVHSDFSRLARFLTGTSIGLVLGGGGARGAAHVGMIRAIVEAGIPIDMVGGVSIGAFMGALWCQEKDLTSFTQKARSWSMRMTSYWRQMLDLTYPVTAMFTGACFNQLIQEVFGERQIEDLWLPYFTITTDITNSSMRIHTHGSLWRYVRSSMSLSGYMPPLCDPVDGHLLLDGGYVNNLPADIMRDMGAETIIAIDVGSQDETDLTNYGDTLSGWWLLWKRWNPWSSNIKVPSLPEIQSRLAYVSCVRQLEQVKRSDYCTYIRPPIDKYKTLQFGSFDEIMDVGYTHGKTLFTAMSQGQKSLQSLLQKEKVKHHQEGVSLSNASFTDLAEMVCKIKTPNRKIQDEFEDDADEADDDDDEDDEQEAGYSSELDPFLLSDMEKEEDLSPVRHRKPNSLSDAEGD